MNKKSKKKRKNTFFSDFEDQIYINNLNEKLIFQFFYHFHTFEKTNKIMKKKHENKKWKTKKLKKKKNNKNKKNEKQKKWKTVTFPTCSGMFRVLCSEKQVSLECFKFSACSGMFQVLCFEFWKKEKRKFPTPLIQILSKTRPEKKLTFNFALQDHWSPSQVPVWQVLLKTCPFYKLKQFFLKLYALTKS